MAGWHKTMQLYTYVSPKVTSMVKIRGTRPNREWSR